MRILSLEDLIILHLLVYFHMRVEQGDNVQVEGESEKRTEIDTEQECHFYY